MDIGPVLPPHLAQKSKQLREQESTKDEEKVQGITENEKYLEKRDEEKSDEDESYGPTLPPGFPKREGHCSNSRIIGPMRPQFSEHHVAPIINVSENSGSEEDDDIIGPSLPYNIDTDADLERTKMDIEARSRAQKDRLSGKTDTKPKRETWMTELPADLSKNFGLGPRKFRNRAVELGDQSVWTDTPADKARKSKEGVRSLKRGTDDDEPIRSSWELARDKEMGNQVENYNKRHRGESLMDMHSKKLQKQKDKDKDKPPERRPFDRDKDLNLPRMSDDQKKSVIKKSKELGSRFQPPKSQLREDNFAPKLLAIRFTTM
ncbi:GPALPP motifs-containing protein 1-like isoform X2 [Acropora muricata]|uniref:GPALPP motifs-containing protein 1-like isoform X2 n=1 Tax=Acropora muricata TaxID=159855 RepID=UPI0034E3C07A